MFSRTLLSFVDINFIQEFVTPDHFPTLEGLNQLGSKVAQFTASIAQDSQRYFVWWMLKTSLSVWFYESLENFAHQ